MSTEQHSELVQWAGQSLGIEPAKALATIKACCFGQQTATNEQLIAFLHICRKYNLDPLAKQVHAFVTKAGGVQPIVGVDGWAQLANAQPAFNGVEFEDHFKAEALYAITCRVYRKDREKPTEVTEYMSECRRDTEVWKRWPARMLRHKAFVQAVRYAFGFAGIIDPDEAERFRETEARPAGAGARLKEMMKPAEAAAIPTSAEAKPSASGEPGDAAPPQHSEACDDVLCTGQCLKGAKP